MSYSPYYPSGWQTGEAGATPITPAALNYVENGIKNAQNEAENAKLAATNAASDANTAQTTANTAKSTADAAQSTANAAQTTANTAKSTADAALPKTGGTLTGTLTTNGLNLTSGTDYGDTLPSNPSEGRLFFIDADVADRLGL